MPPRYVDASVFVHAYIRPRRELKAHERGIKSHARAIVARINEGEDVVTSTVQVAEGIRVKLAVLLEILLPLRNGHLPERGCLRRERLSELGDAAVAELDLAYHLRLGPGDSRKEQCG